MQISNNKVYFILATGLNANIYGTAEIRIMFLKRIYDTL